MKCGWDVDEMWMGFQPRPSIPLLLLLLFLQVKISDYANTGAYGFGNGEQLKLCIDNLLGEMMMRCG